MSFERWIMRLAEGYYTEFGDPEEPFTYVDGKFGCIFVLRVAQAGQHPGAVAHASKLQPEHLASRFSYGLRECVWDPRHELETREAAVRAAPDILEAMGEAAKAAGGAWLFWENIVYGRRWWIPGDEAEMRSTVESAVVATMKSSTSNIRDGAEHALWLLHDQG